MISNVRRWFAGAQFTHRDAAVYGSQIVALAALVAGAKTGEHWLYVVTASIYVILLAYSLWYAVRLVVLLTRRQRERRVARAAYRARFGRGQDLR